MTHFPTTSFYAEDYFQELQRSLPPIFTRATICKLLGGIFTPRTLSNLDALGKGPGQKVHIGKKVAYRKEDFIYWLKRQMGYGTGNFRGNCGYRA